MLEKLKEALEKGLTTGILLTNLSKDLTVYHMTY